MINGRGLGVATIRSYDSQLMAVDGEEEDDIHGSIQLFGGARFFMSLFLV